MMFPASMLGKITMSVSPVILLSIFLWAAAWGSKATSKAMGPSMTQGSSAPRAPLAAYSTSPAASTVDWILGSTISLAVRAATLGVSRPMDLVARRMFFKMSFFCSRLGATLMPLSEQ